jgi:hypothetical protein
VSQWGQLVGLDAMLATPAIDKAWTMLSRLKGKVVQEATFGFSELEGHFDPTAFFFQGRWTPTRPTRGTPVHDKLLAPHRVDRIFNEPDDTGGSAKSSSSRM